MNKIPTMAENGAPKKKRGDVFCRVNLIGADCDDGWECITV